MRDLTITNGVSDGPGGGIYNGGDLLLDRVIITNNRTTVLGAGGGIYGIDSSLTMINSVVSENIAAGTGGGIRGGARVVIRGSVIATNVANAYGGGIEGVDELVVESSILTENKASSGGGIAASRMVSLVNSAVLNNTASFVGGGLEAASAEAVSLTNSVFVGNKAQSGAAIHNQGVEGDLPFEVFPSYLTATNVTIAGNESSEGGAVAHEGPGLLTMMNTLLADNSGGNCFGQVTSAGHNLDDNGSCGFGSAGDISGVDAMVGPLSDHGGVMVHPLRPGSPAIDAGSNDACPDTDQRGLPRPADGNGDGIAVCDIGSYEHHPLHGDANCDGWVNAVDALYVLRWTAGVGPPVPPECEPLADADCSGAIDAVDALAVLRYVAALPVNAAPGCPALGQPP
jgi:hypothetical protein